MRTAALREELRERDVLLEADGLTLHVDAPAGALTDELRTALRENKHALTSTSNVSAADWRRPRAVGW